MKDDYVTKQYIKFIDKNGYIPVLFDVYNCREIKENIVPTLATGGVRELWNGPYKRNG